MERFINFTTTIGSISKDVIRIKSRVMEEYGLKGSSVNCFFYLYQHQEGLTLTELSKKCEEDKAATSRVVNELIKKGYVSQSESKTGSLYRAILTLTADGVKIAEQVNLEIEKVFKICGLEEDARDDFYNIIRVVADRLHEYN